jgi:hypothetical protein
MVVAPQHSERVAVTSAGRDEQLGSTIHHPRSSAPDGRNSRPKFDGTDAAERGRGP